MKETFEQAVRILGGGGRVAVLTGAGISVESGIPDFRSAEGLWSRYDPSEYATIEAFRADPRRVWHMLAEMIDVLEDARPNAAHRALARLEAAGVVEGIITQNVDGLHQVAGSRCVIEFHGSHRTLSCLACGERCTHEEARPRGTPPECSCGELLKPDVVFFGEDIPRHALEASYRLASGCRTMLVIGTSAEVAPASQMPLLANRNGATVIEVNLERTCLTHGVSDLFLQGPAGTVVARLADEVLARLGEA
ncbi:MAG: NAD-dependent deacylase [Deltaproteobacteria bacterium]|nr:NAD-dependent deacylase [Deltaproteobacteria bacterium]